MSKLIFSLLVLSTLTACENNGSTSYSPLGDSGNSQQGVKPGTRTSIDFRSATSSQCSSGGGVYTLYVDANENGILDVTEVVTNVQVVCNGVNGANGADGTNGSNGFNTVFAMNSVSTGLSACASGHGQQISFGLDLNRNSVLDAGEIAQTQVLCDGTDGANGVAGPAGSNGASTVFQVLPATAEVCANGGSTIMMALDVNHTGVYSAMDPEQQSATICNGAAGANGSNGHDGMNGVTPAYSVVEPIMPCGNSVAYKEVLLRLSNGQILASFSENASGLNTRFSFLPDGSYIDTDGSNCNFSVSTQGGVRSISWFGQVQMSWPVTQ